MVHRDPTSRSRCENRIPDRRQQGPVRPAAPAARRRAAHAGADDRGGHRCRAGGLPLAPGAPPARAHRVLLPRARATPDDPGAGDREGRDRHLHLRGDALPPDACGRAVRHHRQPLQGTALHDDVARVSRRVLGPVRHSAGEAARPLPRGREDLAGGVQGRALRLRREALAGRAGAAHARALSGGRLADLGRRQREPRVDPPLGRVRAGDDGRPVAALQARCGTSASPPTAAMPRSSGRSRSSS